MDLSPGAAAMVAALGAEAREQFERHRAAHVAAIAGILEEGVTAGAFAADLDVAAIAALIDALILDAPIDDPGRTADAAVALVRRGLSP